jgi:hypothetical protein
MVAGTAAVVEAVSTVEVVADFMEAAGAGSTGEEDLAVEAEAARLAVGIRMADIVVDMVAEAMRDAATTAVVVTTVDTAVTVGEAGVTAGATDTVTVGAVGAGDLAMAGRTGDLAGDIRMATTATGRGITPTHIRIPTRRTGVRMELRKII